MKEFNKYTYDAWGNYKKTNLEGKTFADHSADRNGLLYRGYYYDTDLGLYYLGSRYYDANIGRFISPDDIGYLGANGDINAYNLYAYCSNNPVMFSDPTGHAVISLSAALLYSAFAILGAVVAVGLVQTAGETLVVPDILESAKEGINVISDGVKNLIKTYAASLQLKKQYDSKEGHHIVAKKDLRAFPARIVLDKCDIGINSDENIVEVKKGYHRVLHTNLYYGILNATILAGYIFEGDSGVHEVLKYYKYVLGGL